ncbi:transcription initiation factor TFIID subunit A domain-containing protein [Trichoderma barbatum]
MQHVNKMTFRPPVQLADKSVDAAKWIEEMKERYARALMTMETTKNKVASWEKLLTDRAAQGNPYKDEELRQIQLRKEQQLKLYTEAHKWVEGVRKQQGSLQGVAQAQAQANQATAGAAGAVHAVTQPGNATPVMPAASPAVAAANKPQNSAQMVNNAVAEAAKNQQQQMSGVNRVPGPNGIASTPTPQPQARPVPSASVTGQQQMQGQPQMQPQMQQQMQAPQQHQQPQQQMQMQMQPQQQAQLQQQVQPQGQPQGQPQPQVQVKTEPPRPAPVNTALASAAAQAQVAQQTASPAQAAARVPTPQTATPVTGPGQPTRALSHSAAMSLANQRAAGSTPGSTPLPNQTANINTAAVTATTTNPNMGVSGAQLQQGHPHAHPTQQQPTVQPRMPIPKQLPEKATAVPQGVAVGGGVVPGRPTMSQGGGTVGGVMNQPAVPRVPAYNHDAEGDHVLSKKKLDELVRQVCGASAEGQDGNMLTPEVEESVLNLADSFVDNVLHAACRNSKERGSKVLEIRDIQLILERTYNIRVPGYSSDELRTVRKVQPSTGWIAKMSAVQAAKVMPGKGE